MVEYASTAEERGLEVIIAGAGGAAHLPGMTAGHTLLPVIGVPVQSRALNGLDSLLSIVQMPGGVPVATMAIGKAGAINAALYAVAILALTRPELREKLRAYRAARAAAVMEERLGSEIRLLSHAIENRKSKIENSSRRHGRRLRQRAVGPHVGDGGPAAGLSHPHLFAGDGHAHGHVGRPGGERGLHGSGRGAGLCARGGCDHLRV